jgi:hypothetical protein
MADEGGARVLVYSATAFCHDQAVTHHITAHVARLGLLHITHAFFPTLLLSQQSPLPDIRGFIMGFGLNNPLPSSMRSESLSLLAIGRAWKLGRV